MTKIFSKSQVKKEILTEARVLNLPAGSAEQIAEKTAEKVATWVNQRSEVTDKDIERKIVENLARYNKDLAEIYKIRGKII